MGIPSLLGVSQNRLLEYGTGIGVPHRYIPVEPKRCLGQEKNSCVQVSGATVLLCPDTDFVVVEDL